MPRFKQAVENNRFSKSLISWKRMQFWKIEVYHQMLNNIPNVMAELAPKGPRFVETIEIVDWPDIPLSVFYTGKINQNHMMVY